MSRSPALTAGGAAGLAVVSTAVWLFLVGNGGHDDSHITYWAAESMCRFGLPTNYNGLFVEQSSTPGFTVLLALFACTLPIATPTLGVALSLTGRLLTLGLLYVAGEQARPRMGLWAVAVASTEPVFAYWATSGMEMSFVGLGYLALALGTVAAAKGRRGGLAAAGVLVVCMRPEGVVVVGCLLLALACLAVVDPALRRRAFWIEACVPLAVAGLIAGVRRAVYGAWMPQPVLAKALHDEAGIRGLSYLWNHGALAGWTLLVAAALLGIGLWKTRQDRGEQREGWVFGALLLAGSAFIVFSGGDWMRVGRFFSPLTPLSIGAAAWGCARLPPRVAVGTGLLLVARQLYVGQLVVIWLGTGRPLPDAVALQQERQAFDYPLVELANAAHTRDVDLLAVIERHLPRIRARGEQPVVIQSGQAGMVPYYLFGRHDDLVFVDSNSLTTNMVNRCLPQSAFQQWGTGLHFGPRVFNRFGAEILEGCGVDRPAIVYESGQSARRVLWRTDYAVVSRIPAIRRPGTLFGNRERSDGWVAIRRDLLPR